MLTTAQTERKVEVMSNVYGAPAGATTRPLGSNRIDKGGRQASAVVVSLEEATRMPEKIEAPGGILVSHPIPLMRVPASQKFCSSCLLLSSPPTRPGLYSNPTILPDKP